MVAVRELIVADPVNTAESLKVLLPLKIEEETVALERYMLVEDP